MTDRDRPRRLTGARARARFLVALAIASAAVLAPVGAAGREKPAADCCQVHWGYEDPARWPSLSPCYAPCDGGEQSPIDIERPETRDLPPLEFSYGVLHELAVENNGHTVEAKVSAQDAADKVTLRLQGSDYRLLQFHFHAPSEHRVAGEEVPIELHLVHSGPGGRLAVVGVFIREGAPNAELSKIWSHLPKRPGQETEVHDFDLRGLLPKSLASYRYAGSLTTPACGQGVQWIVLARPLTLAAAQIDDFQRIYSGKLFPDGNRRPLQPLNGRLVATDAQPR